MAILDRGILGGGRNAVGTVVMTKWRGKDVIRARVTPANPQTAAQTTQRDLFAALTRAGSTLIDAFIRPYWRRYEGSGRSATTAFNEFVRANVYVMRSDAVAGAPAGTFDPAQMLLTRGGLAPAEPLADDGLGETLVTWDVAGGQAAGQAAPGRDGPAVDRGRAVGPGAAAGDADEPGVARPAGGPGGVVGQWAGPAHLRRHGGVGRRGRVIDGERPACCAVRFR
ncbi:DUF6266 family protein [Rubrivirga sp. IMCC45206]|uniref:DUF6266 family protein n=1 Tax=Rubrivirga sp. IMCC45206 TaxID=3391614 RepID=UPI00399003A1